jgi:DNA processing protein
MNRSELVYKIGITLIPGIGDINAKKIIAYCGGVEAVFKEKKKALMKIPGVGLTVADSIIKNKVLARAEEEIEFLEKNKITPLFFLDKKYPERLKHCADSPVMLYYKGNADMNVNKVVGIVGTRNATEYGKKICSEIVEGLTPYDVMIISGLAYGIDVHAHKAALQSGLNTIGVLGHGLDRLYPSVHKPTAEKMISQGGLLTDFKSDTTFLPENFPKRNRIVAGLVDALIVIEAAKEGGALITADIANSYSRDVYAVPGRVDDHYSEGCNYLIKTNKAALINSAADIIYFMGWEEKKKKKTGNIQKQLFVELSEDEKKVVDLLTGEDSLSVDVISIKINLKASKVAAILLNLEFMGIIKCLPGKMYKIL